MSAAATEQDLDPLVAEEIRPFNLPAGERVIESYSCALLPTSLLIHGRLYVTPRFVCFGSWGATRLVLPMEDISFIEKANTMVRGGSFILPYDLSHVWTGGTADIPPSQITESHRTGHRPQRAMGRHALHGAPLLLFLLPLPVRGPVSVYAMYEHKYTYGCIWRKKMRECICPYKLFHPTFQTHPRQQ